MNFSPRRTALAVPLVVLVLAGPLVGQEPTVPPPASSTRTQATATPLELLPAIGRIGSEVGILGGASWSPYEVGQGFHVGGFLNVPLFRVSGGTVSYELLVALSSATGEPFTLTDPIAYVANLAAGSNPAAALAGPPAAPFPVRRRVRTKLRLFQVSPFGLRYTIKSLDHARLRPYFGAGLDVVVVISKQTPEASESLEFTGTSPFDADLIGGLVAQAPELVALGLPSGQGNLELGFHAGAGVEIRVSRGISVNLDYRFTGVGGTRARHHATTAALGFHW